MGLTFSSVNPYLISVALVFAVTLSLGTHVSAQEIEEKFESEIKDFIKEGTEQMIKSISEDIDIDSDNLLNTNDEEVERVVSTSKIWFDDLMRLFFSTKDVTEAGVEMIAPFDIAPILVFGVSVAISIAFVITIVKKLAWHIFIIILVVLGIGAIIIYFQFT